MKPALWHGRTWSSRESRRGWVVLLLLVSCSRAESAGPFEARLRLYEAGRRAEAIPSFDRAIAADPKQKEAWLYRGRAYGETKNDGEAFRSYEQALRLDPCYAEACFRSRRTCRPTRFTTRPAIRLDPKNWNALAARCAFHYDFLNYSAGVADCTAAIGLHPDDPTLYANRAAIFHALGRPQEARADATRAVGLDPAMRDFINDTIRAHDQAEATRRRMLEEFRAGAGSGQDPCSAYSGNAQQACRSPDMPAPSRLQGAGTAEDHQKYGR